MMIHVFFFHVEPPFRSGIICVWPPYVLVPKVRNGEMVLSAYHSYGDVSREDDVQDVPEYGDTDECPRRNG
jgi:hypothetical protein